MRLPSSEEVVVNNNKFKILAVIWLLGVLGGCKVGVAVFVGGNVTSLSGARDCEAMYTCVFEVTSTDFNETFTAVPAPGYRFSNWKSGSYFLCGDSTDPVCVVDNTGLAGNEVAADIIASDVIFYLLPEFEYVGAVPPIVLPPIGY